MKAKKRPKSWKPWFAVKVQNRRDAAYCAGKGYSLHTQIVQLPQMQNRTPRQRRLMEPLEPVTGRVYVGQTQGYFLTGSDETVEWPEGVGFLGEPIYLRNGGE